MLKGSGLLHPSSFLFAQLLAACQYCSNNFGWPKMKYNNLRNKCYYEWPGNWQSIVPLVHVTVLVYIYWDCECRAWAPNKVRPWGTDLQILTGRSPEGASDRPVPRGRTLSSSSSTLTTVSECLASDPNTQFLTITNCILQRWIFLHFGRGCLMLF